MRDDPQIPLFSENPAEPSWVMEEPPPPTDPPPPDGYLYEEPAPGGYGWGDLDRFTEENPDARRAPRSTAETETSETQGRFQAGGGIPEEIYEGLNPRQREAVEALEGPVLIVAGAGSGKTRVLTRRVAAHIAAGVDPSRILAITFTNKAAAEMRTRVAELVGSRALDQMWVSTFHAACVRILRMKGPMRWFSIVDAGDAQKIVRGVLEDLGYDKETLAGGFVRKVASHISRAKNQLAPPRGDNQGGAADAAVKAYAGYQAQLRKMKAYDFDDLLLETVKLLRNDEDARRFFAEKFQYVLIDEYQDTNRAQYAITAMLAANHRNLCVVGDPDQSVYRFRGATVENILSFERDWPDARVVVLDQNYRSTQKILEAANAVREGMDEGQRAELWTEGEAGEPVKLHVAYDDREEAEFVSRRVNEEGRPGDHAVLFRTNAQSRPLEEALMAAGVPYKIVGGTRFYDRAEVKDALAYLRFCVNPIDVMAFNRIVNTPRRGVGAKAIETILDAAEKNDLDLLEAARVVADPAKGGRSAAAVGRFVAFCDKVMAAIETNGPAAALEVVLLGADGSRSEFHRQVNSGVAPEKAMLAAMGQTGQGAMYSKYGDDGEAERLQNLFELGRAAAEFTSGAAPATLTEGGMVFDLAPRAQTEAYLEHVTLVSDLDSVDTGSDAVLLMTIHAAKGLEFPHVTVVGMEDGLLPLRFGRGVQSKEELAEERRLAYVAVTRAEKTLCLTRARRRFMYGRVDENDESEFLAAIKDSVALEVSESGPSVSGTNRPWGQDRWGESTAGWRGGGRRQGGSSRWVRPDQASMAGGSPKTQPQRSTTHRRPSGDDWKFSQAPEDTDAKFRKTVSPDLAVGAVVTHPSFGQGVVVLMDGEADNAEVTVRFADKVGTKILLARYAPLTVVSTP